MPLKLGRKASPKESTNSFTLGTSASWASVYLWKFGGASFGKALRLPVERHPVILHMTVKLTGIHVFILNTYRCTWISHGWTCRWLAVLGRGRSHYKLATGGRSRSSHSTACRRAAAFAQRICHGAIAGESGFKPQEHSRGLTGGWRHVSKIVHDGLSIVFCTRCVWGLAPRPTWSKTQEPLYAQLLKLAAVFHR